MKKSPPAVVLVRLLAAKGILQRRTYRQAIQHGFGRQNSCLSLVIVVRNPAPKIKPTARASERGQSSVRKSAESLLRLRTSRQRTNCGPVRRKKTARNFRKRQQPRSILPTKTLRACPDCRLV